MYEEFVKNHPNIFWVAKRVKAYAPYLFKKPLKNNYSEINNPPFLLTLGSGRSGNTLLRRLLMENLDIYIPPETYVLPKIAEYRISTRYFDWNAIVDLCVSSYEYHPEFETFSHASLRDFALDAKQWDLEKRNIQNLIRELYLWFAKKADMNCKWVGDKTPINTLHIYNINKVIPGAMYIYILRDGVDVCASYVKAGIYTNYAEAAKRWVQSHKSWEQFKKYLPESRYVEIKYEDLVVESNSLIGSISNKFNIPYRADTFNITDKLGDATMRKHHVNSLKEPTTDSIGKGRESLTQAQRNEIKHIINPTLKRLNYQQL